MFVVIPMGMLWQVGGLETATRKLEKMTPPEPGMAVLSSDANPQTDLVLPKAHGFLTPEMFSAFVKWSLEEGTGIIRASRSAEDHDTV